MEKSVAAKVLDIPEGSDEWAVYDQEDSLVLVHNTLDCSSPAMFGLRGVIVDTATEEVVCPPMAVPEHVVTVSMRKPLAFMMGSLSLKTEGGESIILKESHITIRRGYDGELVRCFRRNGRTYMATQKRIDDPRIEELMLELLPGPVVTGDYLLVHPSLQTASRYAGPARLLYMGPVGTSSAFCERPEVLTPLEMNAFLKHGYDTVPGSVTFIKSGEKQRSMTHFEEEEEDDNPVLTEGECVFVEVYHTEAKEALKSIVRIKSAAYDWRASMRNNDPSLEHLVFNLAAVPEHELSTREGRRWFANRYLPIALPDSEASLPSGAPRNPGQPADLPRP